MAGWGRSGPSGGVALPPESDPFKNGSFKGGPDDGVTFGGRISRSRSSFLKGHTYKNGFFKGGHSKAEPSEVGRGDDGASGGDLTRASLSVSGPPDLARLGVVSAAASRPPTGSSIALSAAPIADPPPIAVVQRLRCGSVEYRISYMHRPQPQPPPPSTPGN